MPGMFNPDILDTFDSDAPTLPSVVTAHRILESVGSSDSRTRSPNCSKRSALASSAVNRFQLIGRSSSPSSVRGIAVGTVVCRSLDPGPPAGPQRSRPAR